MRIRRTRTRRLPETLPLACHGAVSGALRATWENTRVERGSTRVLEGANGTGSGALVLANVLRVSRQGCFLARVGKRPPAVIVVASGHGCRHHRCHHHRYQHQVAVAILVVIIAISATPLLVVLFMCWVVLFTFWGGPV